MAQTTTGNRQHARATSTASSWSQEPVAEMSRAAEELLGRSTRSAFDLSAALVEAGQRMSDELFALSVEAIKDLLQLSGDLRAATLSTFRASYQPWVTGQPALEGVQRVLDTATQATSRLMGTFQASTEGGAQRMKDVVILLTDQAKEATGT